MLTLCMLATLAAAGDVPLVNYAVKVETRTWQPLAPADVEVMLEGAALAPFSAGGLARVARAGFAELGKGDYVLLIQGRFIEEAEKISVYFTFSPGVRTDLPSFHVAATEAIGHRSPTEMQKIIEAMTRKLAERLRGVIEPRLASARVAAAPPPIETVELPWSWGEIEVPKVPSGAAQLRELVDVRNEDHVRAKALAAIEGSVFDQPAARDAVILCALRDPSEAQRARCVEALEPVARTHVPTQRLLLHAMRNEVSDVVLGQLAKLSAGFVGLSRKEAIETWLELAASDATPPGAAEEVTRLLAAEGDVPNLDLAVATCLQQSALMYGKKTACANNLMRVIPPARRAAVAWRYLENVKVFDQGETNTYDSVVESVVGRGDAPVDAALAELFLRIAERPSAGRARWQAAIVAGRHPRPTPETLARLITISYEPRLTRMSLRSVEQLVKREPALQPIALAALRKMQSESSFIVQKTGGDPRREIKETLARLERSQR